MNTATDFNQAFEFAKQLHTLGKFAEAEKAYQQLVGAGENREMVLRALVELYMQSRQPSRVIDTLVALTEEVPDELYYYGRLATVLDGIGETSAAIDHYLRLLERQPEYATAYFNVALLYKKSKRYAEALEAYQQAIKNGIDDVPEVYSNMGVLYAEMRQKSNAEQMYQQALDNEPDYIPALFNLAGLLEESGERQQAIELYERILSINPGHWDSLSRLAHAKKVTAADTQLIDSLKRAAENTGDDPVATETLCFALGKALDDIEQYDEAFTVFSRANEIGKQRNPLYNKSSAEQAFRQLSDMFSAEWIERATGTSMAAPIFICGMYRSGSTLVEQILASHPSVTAGGELDYLPRLVAERLSPYPDAAISASAKILEDMGQEYISRIQSQFPEATCITDKRPDNFLHLGLINQKIIYLE